MPLLYFLVMIDHPSAVVAHLKEINAIKLIFGLRLRAMRLWCESVHTYLSITYVLYLSNTQAVYCY